MRPHEDTNGCVVDLGKRSGAKSSLLNKTVTWWCGSDKTRAVSVVPRDDGEQVELMFDDEDVDGS